MSPGERYGARPLPGTPLGLRDMNHARRPETFGTVHLRVEVCQGRLGETGRGLGPSIPASGDKCATFTNPGANRGIS